MPIPIRLLYAIIILLFTVFAVSGAFELSMEPEIGYKTAVPKYGSDSAYQGAFYFGTSLSPDWNFYRSKKSACDLSGSVMYSYFGSGRNEFSIDPELSFTASPLKNPLRTSVGISYSSFLSAYDSTQPQKFAEYSLRCEKKWPDKTLSSLSYSLSVVEDAASSRIDIKNAIKAKFTKKISKSTTFFAKPGIIWDVSNSSMNGYIEPTLSLGSSLFWAKKNALAFQIHAGYPIYQETRMIFWKRKGNKFQDSLALPSQPGPRIPITLIMTQYYREISNHLNFFCSHEFMARDPGKPAQLYTSHTMSMGLEWNIFKKP